ncbi:MAG: glycosyltransferase [Sphingobacteriales bacterium]|jgi:glycosyltransferase involved in cell wall biosynthesis|nr:glycosyltransferase [Sphingobacteriales bacterium]
MLKEPQIEAFLRPSDSASKFSILIPSWNNLPYLKLCIQSIEKNSAFKHQIIIHVNEGIDNTLQWVKDSAYSYTYSSENVGVCYALNAMSKLVRTNYILYVNDDMYLAKNWDLYLDQEIALQANHLFYFSATMVEFDGGSNKAILAPYDFGRTYDTFDESAFLLFAASHPKTDWFGSCWPPSLVHKEVWDKVNGYDVDYTPGFYSDPDFAMKLWEIGVREFKGIGKSLVYHFKCKSTGRVIRNNGRKTFAKKWGIPSSFLYKEMLLMGQTYDSQITLKKPNAFKMFLAKCKAWYISIT